MAGRWLRGWTTRVIAALWVVALIGTWLVGTGSPAYANTTGNELLGGFQIDGDFAVNGTLGGTDWNAFPNALAVHDEINTGSLTDSTNFKSGDKESDSPDSWIGGSNTAPGKDDIGNVYVLSRVLPGTGNQPNLWGYFGLEREKDDGTTYYDIELNQLGNHTNSSGISVPTRSKGDALLVISQSGNGAFDVSGTVQFWTGSAWGTATQLDSSDFYGLSNDSTIPGFGGSGTIASGDFAEMAVNLSAIGAALGCPSTGFTALNLRSRASTASDAELKDYASAGIDIPSSCGELKIVKKTSTGAALDGVTFTIHPNPVPGGTGDLVVTDGQTGDADGTANGTVDIDPAVPGDYTVYETHAPSPYVFDPTTGYPVTVDEFGSGTDAASVTIVNSSGSVSWTKDDAGTGAAITYGGATFTVYGPAATQSAAGTTTTVAATVTDNDATDANKTTGQFEVDGLAAGWYRVVETAAPAGFALDPSAPTFQISAGHLSATVPAFSDPRTTFSLTVEKLASDGETQLDGAHFSLYEVGDPDTVVGTCVTGTPDTGTGECSIGGLAWGQKYYWVETVPPPGYNLPSDVTGSTIPIDRTTVQSSLTPTVFEDPTTSLSTVATTTANVGDAISDTATLGNLNGTVSGTVVYRAYGPFDSATAGEGTCSGDAAYTSDPVDVTGNGSVGANTPDFVPTSAGYYFWVATFTSDNTDNAGAVGECGEQGEVSHVLPLTPQIQTTAETGVTIGSTISDTATVSGGDNPSGTVTFSLYGDATCSQDPLVSETVGLVDGQAKAQPYLPTSVGTYYWVAKYNGDTNNSAVSGHCGDTGESSTVVKAIPSIQTTATSTAVVGTAIQDTATVSNGYGPPTGTVTFVLYSDATCSNVVGSSAEPLQADGTSTSGGITTSATGTYYWIATYSGDASNESVHGTCTDTGEETTVTAAQPSISTQATDSVQVGGSISDTATVSGGFHPDGGTVTFTLYSDSSCNDTVGRPSTATLVNGTATSAAYPIDTAGTYYWIASYGGDANNLSVTGKCGDDGESSQVTKAPTTLTTSADESASLASAELVSEPSVTIQDTATLHGATADAGGTVTFTLYGPTTSGEDAVCDSDVDQVGSSTNPVVEGSATSDAISVSAPGWYWWVASYSGDGNNEPSQGDCGDEGEATHVTQGKLALKKTADPEPGSIVQPGQEIDYTVTVPNSGDADVTGATVTDTLPPYVVVDTSSISDGGVFAAGSDDTKSAGTITWSDVTVPANTSTTGLTYTVHVAADAPQGELLTNLAQLGTLSSSTTHQVAAGALTLAKSVLSLAGDNSGSYTAGDPHNTLVYTLTGQATGTLVQTNVVVTDILPGYDPSLPKSGLTTYVDGSATCSTDCTPSYDAATHTLSWPLGTVQPGSTFTLTFEVTIDKPAFDPAVGLPIEAIDNISAVASDQQPSTPSNEVVTPVTAVLAVKVVKKPPVVTPPQTLPFTGMPVAPRLAATVALLMVGTGLLMTRARRRRS